MMGKPLDQVTDEDLARNGLADFSINPRRVMPWRTERELLTGEAPTEEEWQAIVSRYNEEPTRIATLERMGYFDYRRNPNYGRF